MRKLIFEAKRGIFGEDGYIRISFFRWLWMFLEGGYVIRARKSK